MHILTSCLRDAISKHSPHCYSHHSVFIKWARKKEKKFHNTLADIDNNTKRQYLGCNRHCSTFHIVTFNPQNCSMYEVSAVIKPILQMRKLRQTALVTFPSIHTNKWQCESEAWLRVWAPLYIRSLLLITEPWPVGVLVVGTFFFFFGWCAMLGWKPWVWLIKILRRPFLTCGGVLQVWDTAWFGLLDTAFAFSSQQIKEPC